MKLPKCPWLNWLNQTKTWLGSVVNPTEPHSLTRLSRTRPRALSLPLAIPLVAVAVAAIFRRAPAVSAAVTRRNRRANPSSSTSPRRFESRCLARPRATQTLTRVPPCSWLRRARATPVLRYGLAQSSNLCAAVVVLLLASPVVLLHGHTALPRRRERRPWALVISSPLFSVLPLPYPGPRPCSEMCITFNSRVFC